MKRGLFLFFIVLFSISAYARSIDLITNSNYQIEDKNITLLRVYEDKALVCVNGFKTIVTEDVIKKVNGVNIELNSVKDNIATFNFDYSCKGECTCKEDCNNNVCFDNINEETKVVQENKIQPEETALESQRVDTAKEKREVVTNDGISITGAIAAILIIIILFLGVIILWIKY